MLYTYDMAESNRSHLELDHLLMPEVRRIPLENLKSILTQEFRAQKVSSLSCPQKEALLKLLRHSAKPGHSGDSLDPPADPDSLE